MYHTSIVHSLRVLSVYNDSKVKRSTKLKFRLIICFFFNYYFSVLCVRDKYRFDLYTIQIQNAYNIIGKIQNSKLQRKRFKSVKWNQFLWFLLLMEFKMNILFKKHTLLHTTAWPLNVLGLFGEKSYRIYKLQRGIFLFFFSLRATLLTINLLVTCQIFN